MEVVNDLPRPTDPAALERLVEAQRILTARAVSEEDCEQAHTLLEELAAASDQGGFDYFPALLTLASLHAAGFEPAIDKDESLAARYYLRFLAHDRAATDIGKNVLEEAATQLCNLVKDGQANLEEAERFKLKELAQGEGAGSVPCVATWVRYASAEADRLFREASEDPAARERRIARQAAREAAHAQEIEKQRSAAQGALARAEELQHEGNDLCRQGQLPGNAKARQLLSHATELYSAAIDVLSECLPTLTLAAEEAVEVRRRRGILQSNTAQVHLTLEDWTEVRRFAQSAMEDDPDHAKSWFRLAKAEIKLQEWEAAARTVDQALSKMEGRRGEEADANRGELWRLAEEISAKLPHWQWSASKPAEKRPAEDFERRIVGHWSYGGGKYEICLEPWGALIFKEENIKIDLMRKGKLRWRGEFEMVSGMALNLSYEPGADVLMTEFIPPPDMPEENKWKGPTSFTAQRVAAPPAAKAASTEASEEPAAPPPAPAPAPKAEPVPVQQVEAPAVVKVPDDAPRELWLTGHDGLCGRYKLLPDQILNERPVYQRDVSGASHDGQELFLWYRGGNWGVTAALHMSSLAAPFLIRCADVPGRSRHPLELRRPRWHVRRGRGQEEIDPAVRLEAVASSAPMAQEQPPPSKLDAQEAQSEESVSELPRTLELQGRTGLHSQVNGLYDLSSTSWGGRPVYSHREHRLALFHNHGYWVLAAEVCMIPCALARCSCGARGPPMSGDVWEFLDGQSSIGRMVTVETRTYLPDRAVSLQIVRVDDSSNDPMTGADRAAEQRAEPAPMHTHVNGDSATDLGAGVVATDRKLVVNSAGESAATQPPCKSSRWPSWVRDASAELSSGEIRAAIVASDGIAVSLQSLSLDVALEYLQVGLAGQEALCLALPAAVDTESGPVARWSEKTRTLKVRLALHS